MENHLTKRPAPITPSPTHTQYQEGTWTAPFVEVTLRQGVSKNYRHPSFLVSIIFPLAFLEGGDLLQCSSYRKIKEKK